VVVIVVVVVVVVFVFVFVVVDDDDDDGGGGGEDMRLFPMLFESDEIRIYYNFQVCLFVCLFGGGGVYLQRPVQDLNIIVHMNTK
jgi:hypothetical protein